MNINPRKAIIKLLQDEEAQINWRRLLAVKLIISAGLAVIYIEPDITPAFAFAVNAVWVWIKP